MQKNWFKDWFNSPYYHQLYFNRDEKEAAAFIDKLIKYLQPQPRCTMLDVACGKGRHAVQLAGKGFDVVGIDISQDSIAHAVKNESENLHFYTHDMRLPFWINYFDMAFNFFTSFGYFETATEHNNAIKTIAQSIKPKGTFVMDYLNVSFAEKNLIPHSQKKIEDVNFAITRWHDATHFYKKIEVEDSTQKQFFTYTEKVAKFSLLDFSTMFAQQGLQMQETFGDYNFNAYNFNTSPRLIMIAKKQ